MDPKVELENGVKLLKNIMNEAGFKFLFECEGISSGGKFASGSFILGDKKLELSFRYSLGCVEYRVLEHNISHKDYMEAIGKKKEAQYPGFSNNSTEAFEHLFSDISKHGEIFLWGTNNQFIELIKDFKSKPKKSGFSALT